MWLFGRRRRRPALDLAPLELLGELVERVVSLLEETRAPAPAATEACVETTQALTAAAPDEAAAVVVSAGYVLFVPWSGGYRLVEREGAPPARGERLELDGCAYRVGRLGPSPLPADARRCGFVELEDPPAAARTSDA